MSGHVPAGPGLVPDSRQLWSVYRFQLRSYFRTWRFLGLLVFVAVVSSAILGVQLSRGTDYITTTYASGSDYLSSYLAYLADAVIITAAFLGGDALAVDLGGGPGYLMLTQPVRRSTLLAGRYLAAATVGVAIALVYFAFAVGAVAHFYQSVPSALLVSFGAAVLFGLATLAFAFFFSSFFRNPSVSIVTSLLLLIILFPIVTAVADLVGAEPWFSLDYGDGIITNVLSSSFHHETTTKITGGGARMVTIQLSTWSPYLWEGVAIMAIYLVVFLVAAYLVYAFKEVRG